MPFAVKRIQTGDEELNRVQDSFLPPINALIKIPTLDGRIIDTVTDSNGIETALILTTSFQNIPHKLGRVFRGYQIIDQDADARIWRDPASPPLPSNVGATKFVRLRASATVTVRLWVF